MYAIRSYYAIGTNPAIAKVIRSNADIAHLYPDDSMFELKKALSTKFDVQDENIIIGAGSDQVLEFVSRAILNENSSVLMSAVTFAMYEIYARQTGAKVYRTASHEHKYDEFMEAYNMYKPEIVYIVITSYSIHYTKLYETADNPSI